MFDSNLDRGFCDTRPAAAPPANIPRWPKAVRFLPLLLIALLGQPFAHGQPIPPATNAPPPPDALLHTNTFRIVFPSLLDPLLLSKLNERMYLRTAITENLQRDVDALVRQPSRVREACKRALGWFDRTQNADGSWSGTGNWAHEGSSSRIALTGLAMLSYMSYGQTHLTNGPPNPMTAALGVGDHSVQLAKAVEWMLTQIAPDGALRDTGRMYDHSIGMYALCEAYYLTGDTRLKEPCQKVTTYLCNAQNPTTGGWRYQPYAEAGTERGDLSVSGFCIMALASADYCKLEIAKNNWDGAKAFLKLRGTDPCGYFRYHEDHDVTHTMISVGNYCTQLLAKGGKADICCLLTSRAFLLENLPDKSRMDYYYWFYGSYALHYRHSLVQRTPWDRSHAWDRWYATLEPLLLGKQIKGGANDGSWDPEDARSGTAYGRHATTAFAVLTLGAPIRFRLIQRGANWIDLRDPNTRW